MPFRLGRSRVAAKDGYLPTVREPQAQQYGDGRGLADVIGAKKRSYLAMADCKADVIDGDGSRWLV
jgi:hypothetical protein